MRRRPPFVRWAVFDLLLGRVCSARSDAGRVEGQWTSELSEWPAKSAPAGSRTDTLPSPLLPTNPIRSTTARIFSKPRRPATMLRVTMLSLGITLLIAMTCLALIGAYNIAMAAPPSEICTPDAAVSDTFGSGIDGSVRGSNMPGERCLFSPLTPFVAPLMAFQPYAAYLRHRR